jgi:hypothetical protein
MNTIDNIPNDRVDPLIKEEIIAAALPASKSYNNKLLTSFPTKSSPHSLTPSTLGIDGQFK